MSQDQGYSYQIHEVLYQKGKEAQAEGRFSDAANMYAKAAEALLKGAKSVTGDTKEALVRRAKNLMKLSLLMDEHAGEKSSETKGTDLIQAHAENVGNTPNAGNVGNTHPADKAEYSWEVSHSSDVLFCDIAGLSEVKEQIRLRIILPYQHPEVYEFYHRKAEGGILLYGPPGTGKTMIAKALAGEIDAAFFNVRCSDVVDKYFGEAERKIQSLFETARSYSRSVIFFDEFEAIAAKRGGDSAVMNRLVPELLSQIDGFASNDSGLLILAATNRPWDLDNAFLRPPRFTQKIYVGLPDYEARRFIAGKAFEGVPCDDPAIEETIAAATDGCNAADVKAVCGRIKDTAIRRVIESGEESSAIRKDEIEEILQQTKSSVREEDLLEIKKWETS